jgi:nucleotide-binding universal stress UspA family protein
MPFEKLLIPVDGSQSSYQSIGIATTIARAMESNVTLVNVISGSDRPTGMESGSARDFATTPDYGSISIPVGSSRGAAGREVVSHLDQRAESLVADARAQMPLGDDRVKTDIMRYREPPEAILELVDQGIYDLVIMGNGNDERWDSHDVGGVAMKVVRDSPVAVLVVKKASGLSRLTTLFFQEDDELLERAVEMSKTFGSKLNIIAIEGSEEGCGDAFIGRALEKITDKGITSTSTVVKDDDSEVRAAIESAQTETLLVGKAKLGVLGRIARRNEWIHQLVKDVPCSVLSMP